MGTRHEHERAALGTLPNVLAGRRRAHRAVPRGGPALRFWAGCAA